MCVCLCVCLPLYDTCLMGVALVTKCVVYSSQIEQGNAVLAVQA